MSAHFRRLRGLTLRTLRELEARSRLDPPKVQWRSLYIGSLTAGSGPKMLLDQVAEVVLAGSVFMPRQRTLGAMHHRDARTIRRWLKLLVDRGWLRVVRRGRKLSNVYRLSRHLWGRLTGRYKSRIPAWLQEFQTRMDLRLKAEPARLSATVDSRRL